MIRWFRSMDASPARGRLGIGLAAVTAVVSGVAIFVNAQATQVVGPPAVFTTLKNGVAAILLIALAASVRSRPPSLRNLPGLLALGVIGGSIPFLLFFSGLAEASAPGAAVIHKTLFVWVALLAVVLLRERLGALQIGAMAILLVSTLLIQPPTGVTWGSGETLIALATGVWAVEVIVAKRVLASVPSPVAGASRMGIGLILLTGWLGVTGQLDEAFTLGAVQWAWVLGTGLLLTAYVATWYAALQRAPASAVAAVLTLGLPITALLQMIANGQVPAPLPAAGYGVGAVAALAVAVLAVRRQQTAEMLA
jgi:drug/metabolite transporter (DMT)-like permease